LGEEKTGDYIMIIKKVTIALLMTTIVGFTSILTTTVVKADTVNQIGVQYQSHVQSIGWQNPVSDGAEAGTHGKSLRVEALKLNLLNAPKGAKINYQAHVENIGWQNAVEDGAEAGTDGKSLRVEAIKISLKNLPGYSVQYRVHVQNIGWMDWVSDGQAAGTTGKSLRIEAVEIKLVKTSDNTTVGVQYQGHIQNIGWQNPVQNGQIAGTEGQSLRVEAFKIGLLNAPAGAKINYQTHVQNIGWQTPVSNNAEGGTHGKSLRVEAIKISLGNLPGYSVQYRAHVQNIGWQPWVSDGQEAGTDGKSLRIEAIEIRIVKLTDVLSVSLNKAENTLTVGDTNTLAATVVTKNDNTNKAVTWTSSNKAIASVDNTGKVTAVAPGTATITATTEDGNKTASCNVTVASDNGFGISHITRYDMLKVAKHQNDPQFNVPKFDASTIKNIPSAQGLDVWDSWPLQNANGTVANYKGYNILFALAGKPKTSDTCIYLFYQKIGQTSIDSWKNAGRVFKDSDKFIPNDPNLKHQTEEWSGSATLTDDGKVRLFYTDFSGASEAGGTGDSNQILTTAQVNISHPDEGTFKINGVSDQKSIFDGGNGTIYQNIQQFRDNGLWSSGDNHTLRDPHYVEDNGHKYLVFESNTGTVDGYQGDEALYNKAYYGGDENFFKTEHDKLLKSSKKQLASLANGSLGIVELNDDYTVKKVMKPLIASNTVTDEIERANVFKIKGKWYLFTDSRGRKMTIDGIGDNDIYMLGYVSDSLTGPYKPLNDSGLVLHTNIATNDITFTYSHFAVMQSQDSDNVVITSYMTNRSSFEDHQSTFAPSFLVNINGSKTSVVPNSTLEQGQLTVDK
jgi:levansucrase